MHRLARALPRTLLSPNTIPFPPLLSPLIISGPATTIRPLRSQSTIGTIDSSTPHSINAMASQAHVDPSPPPPPASKEVQIAGIMGTVTQHAARVEAPASERNKQPILELLQQYIPADAQGLKVLEVASGPGQHVAHFAAAYPGVTFQPTDYTTELFESVAAWSEGLSNVCLPPLLVDACQLRWTALEGPDGKLETYDALLLSNMTHIAPWAATLGLIAGAGRHMKHGGRLFMYGPFKRDGQFTSEGNQAFDASLREKNPEWGYRDTADVTHVASSHGLVAVAIHDMPANNFMLVFAKPAPGM